MATLSCVLEPYVVDDPLLVRREPDPNLFVALWRSHARRRPPFGLLKEKPADAQRALKGERLRARWRKRGYGGELQQGVRRGFAGGSQGVRR